MTCRTFVTYHTHKHIYIALYVVYDCMSHDQEIEKVNVTNCEPDLEGSTGSYLMDAIPSV